MQIDRIHIKSFIHIAFICLLSSCAEAILLLRDDAEGYAFIYPEGHTYQLPALVYHFYNTDTQKEYFVRNCDGSGNFSGSLPAGNYYVIATNTTASNVTFNDMYNHELATVTVTSAASRISNQLAMPGNVHSVAFDNLTISHQDTVQRFAVPVLLTKELTLIFTLKGSLLDDVSGLSGQLDGIYPSAGLYNCRPTDTDLVPDGTISFQATPGTDKRWTDTFHLFGICNPKYGSVYRNKLGIRLDLHTGTSLDTHIDLTDILSEVMEQNLGVIPLRLPLLIELSRTVIGLTAEVTLWEESGNSEVIVRR